MPLAYSFFKLLQGVTHCSVEDAVTALALYKKYLELKEEVIKCFITTNKSKKLKTVILPLPDVQNPETSEIQVVSIGVFLSYFVCFRTMEYVTTYYTHLT